MGRALAERDIGVVYGGGRVGLMGAVADAALEAGGDVFGVIPRQLHELELGHTDCTELFVVDSMHSRKMMMAQLSDAFVALPGGFGTLEEMFEALTWTQLNIHLKPVGVLNVDGYYDLLLQWIAHACDEAFVQNIHRDLLIEEEHPVALLERLATFAVPRLDDWIDDARP